VHQQYLNFPFPVEKKKKEKEKRKEETVNKEMKIEKLEMKKTGGSNRVEGTGIG
jgi:hypothetical protein